MYSMRGNDFEASAANWTQADHSQTDPTREQTTRYLKSQEHVPCLSDLLHAGNSFGLSSIAGRPHRVKSHRIVRRAIHVGSYT
jgi:hypothetical protein